jgi:hemoglobin-like flavoprotein
MPDPSASFKRIQESHATLAGRMDEVSRVFYANLFKQHPGVRALFPSDMTKLQGHLAAAVSLICRNLRNFEALEHPLMELGAQHVGFGAKPEHYPVVCVTLVEALREVSGEHWNAQLELDWTELWDRVAQLMIRGAAGASRSAHGAGAVPLVSTRVFGVGGRGRGGGGGERGAGRGES